MFDNPIFLLIVSIVLNIVTCGVLRAKFCKSEVGSGSDLHAFNAMTSALSMLTLFVVCIFSNALALPTMYTVLMAVAYGISTALCVIFNMRALEIGPVSYTTVICSCAMLIPTLSGTILFGEQISLIQYLGIVFMLVSFVFAVDKKNDKTQASVKWLVYCLLAFLMSGTIGIVQKLHQNSPSSGELGVFLVIALGVSMLFSLVAMFVLNAKGQSISVVKKPKLTKFVIYGKVCGVGMAFINQINTFLTGAMDAVIQFPVFNGAVMLSMSVIGVMFFKERLSVKQWIGLGCGVIAIMLICLG